MRDLSGERDGGVPGGKREGYVGVREVVSSGGGSDVARMLGKGTGAEES